MTLQDPFHEGERAVQERAGETGNAILNSRMIAETIMLPALPFIARQPWAILGSLDESGLLWCSALVGEAGFAEADESGSEVRFDLRRAPVHPANPLLPTLVPGRAVGALFIELATRKRLRVNGRLTMATPEDLNLIVEESFPNCPRFIQRRTFEGFVQADESLAQPREGQTLGKNERELLSSADTFFIASAHPGRGVDVSHRGGKPGFIEVVGDSLLRVPDYPGNSLFQTFGNLAVDARSGWLIPDFATGGLLHLTGHARVFWDDPDPLAHTAGTHRFLELEVARWKWTPPVQGAPRWTFLEASPLNP